MKTHARRVRWKRPTVKPGHGDGGVQELLDRLARAITSGDGQAAAELWASPALVISDEQVMAVANREQVAQFFSGAREQYHSRGITDTRADVLRIEQLTPRICIVDVRWPWLDADGKEQGDESSSYILRRDEGGGYLVQAAIMRGASGDEESVPTE